MKEVIDAIMNLMLRKEIITLEEYNDYVFASELSASDQNIKRITEAINNMGK